MFNPNFIEIYDNALSSYNCKEIIKWVENQSLIRGLCLGPNGPRVDTKAKSDWEVHYSKTIFTNKTFVDLIIADVLVKYTPLYRESYPSINNIDPWSFYDDYNIQKYDPGDGYHSLHCENAGESTAQRVLAWMIYLNTVTDKGGTYFSAYNKTINAKEGRLVIWPAYFTHQHKGVVSKTQTKYIVTGWHSYSSDPMTVQDW